jgi:hypothetical protein
MACSTAQTAKTLNLSTQGTLKNLLTESETKTVTSLTLSGNIDARDFAFMRDKIKMLSILDLTSAVIKSYSGSDGTNSEISTYYPANEIPTYAFYNPYLLTYKSSLISIKLPSTLVSIGYLAFYYSWNLTGQISIPASVKSITDYAFYGCSSISSFSVASSNTRYSSLNGVLFSKNQDTLFVFPPSKSGNYTIPNTVKHIGVSAFENCYNLTAITLPTSLNSIGSYAFCYCSGIIGSLTLPSTLKKLEDGAFYGCWNLNGIVSIPSSLTDIGYYCFFESNNITSLSVNGSNPAYASYNDALYSKNMDTLFICPGAKTGEFSIPTSVKLIGSHAFYKCNKITGVLNIPSGVDYIGYYAFYGCAQISEFQVSANNAYFSAENGVLVSKNKDRIIACPASKGGLYQMPTSVEQIDPAAFAYCSNLTGTFSIPSNLTQIGDYAFYGCNQISGFSVDASNPVYSSNDGLLFNRNQDSLLICPLSKSGRYSIPSSVLYIGHSAFDGCLNLTEINIPASVVKIGNYAFEYCAGLTKIRIPRNTSAIGFGAFYSCTNLQEFAIANPNPPVIDYYALDLINKSTCSLIIPSGTKTIYQNAPYWSDFTTMTEYNFETQTPQLTQNTYSVYSRGKEIVIEGTLSGDRIEIYTLNGVLAVQQKANENSTSVFVHTNGVYLVRINNSFRKVIIQDFYL